MRAVLVAAAATATAAGLVAGSFAAVDGASTTTGIAAAR